MNRSTCVAASLLGVFAAAGLGAPAVLAQTGAFVPVTQAMQADPDPGDWLHISRTYDQHRFSPLSQINKGNVAELRMAWSRGLPEGTQESAPIVYRGVMYVMAPGASIQALDATNGDLIWEYERDYPPSVPRTAARSKSLGIYEDMIYFGAPDGFLLALDAQTGTLRWETKVDDGQITAGGLLVADGKVISNRTCQRGEREFCFIAAHDAATGEEVWKFYVTAAPGEPGGDTWGDLSVDQRAAGPWGLPGSYDPVRKVVYWGRGQSESVHTVQAARPLRCRFGRLAIGALQQLDRGARRRDRDVGLVFPGAAWRRLGRRPQSGTHPGSHTREPGPAICQMDQSGVDARRRAGRRHHRRRRRRHLCGCAGDRPVPVGAARSPSTIRTST